MVRTTPLTDPPGVRCRPDRPTGTGVLVLAGSSGRIEAGRAGLLADAGLLAESIGWFGGPGQQPGPWEVPLELFLGRVAALRADCDRVVILGTSFGAEAALLAAAHGTAAARVDAVIAIAPTDVVWAGIRPDGRQTSHWTLGGDALPYLGFDPDWTPDAEPPAYRGLYQRSWASASAEHRAAAAIPVERIRELTLVCGGDDQVWPSPTQAGRIVARRSVHGLRTGLLTEPDAGHRVVLPGERPAPGGVRMRRGGHPEADRRLGERVWTVLTGLPR